MLLQVSGTRVFNVYASKRIFVNGLMHRIMLMPYMVTRSIIMLIVPRRASHFY